MGNKENIYSLFFWIFKLSSSIKKYLKNYREGKNKLPKKEELKFIVKSVIDFENLTRTRKK